MKKDLKAVRAARRWCGLTATIVVALLTTVFPARASEIEDGFYLKSDVGTGQAATNQAGELLHLGAKHPLTVLSATIVSLDNTNSQFDLRVRIPGDGTPSPLQVLVVGGIVYDRNGWGSSGGITELMFPTLGADNAKAVAQYFKTPINYRKDPGYKTAVSFATSKPEYKPGEEVVVTVRIQNAGSEAYAFESYASGLPRNGQFGFTATLDGQPLPDIGKAESLAPRAVSMWSSSRTCVPGEIFTNTIVLNKWFAFDRPGTYVVRGSYFMPFERIDGYGRLSVPPETIWEDKVTGEFNVKIAP